MMKTSELTGVLLDWAVAKCEGCGGVWHDTVATYWTSIKGKDIALSKGWAAMSFTPSTDWAQGGPIIEREGISINSRTDGFEWFACDYLGMNEQAAEKPLEAAMRCYVASKLGYEIKIPEELKGDIT